MIASAGNPERAMLQEAALREVVLPGSNLWSRIDVVSSTGSTNADLLTAAKAGAAAGTVLVAEEQTRGRGRLNRTWQSTPGAALTFSLLLRPVGVPAVSRGWLPLLAGVAVAGAVCTESGLAVSLKWPNDVLAGSGTPDVTGKLAGILAEQAGDAIVVGIGINVGQTQDDLPSSQATSLWLQGASSTDRTGLLVAVLREFEHWYLRWAAGSAPGDVEAAPLRAEYLRLCGTVGRDARVELPNGDVVAGRACDVDQLGRLLIDSAGSIRAVSAGDVIHLR